MKKRISLKNIVIIVSSICLLVFLLRAVRAEYAQCMGVPVISEAAVQEKALYPTDVGNIVLMENQPVPFDEASGKIYLSCQVEDGMKFYELKGKLTSSLPEYQLYFQWQNEFQIISDAVRYGCAFTLYAIDDNGNYAAYQICFTTLPVIEMHGEATSTDDREREIYSGEVTFWDPSYKNSGTPNVQKSALEWHVRGYSSESFLKKSLKLNLKDARGKKNKLSFLDFDSDDDYILNPMWFDDVKVREKLAMELWNELAEEKDSTLKMSAGEYCELIVNGEYQGLRLLQNKIEKSYLKLSKGDILLKGNNVNLGTVKPPEEVYELVYSNQDVDETYEIISDFFYETDFSKVDLDSWVDLQLFLQLGNMKDNEAYKNIYYVIQDEKLRFIPWDTDMSFGIYWEDGFYLLPESVEYVTYRKEYEALKQQYPQVDAMLESRWRELRETVFTEENILGKIAAYRGALDASGAPERDFYYLGWYSWGGEDTLEQLEAYIVERLAVLDEYYGVM